MKKIFIVAAVAVTTSVNFTANAKELNQQPISSQVSVTNYPRGSAWVDVPGHGSILIEFYSYTADGDITGARFDNGMWICEGTITESGGNKYVDVYIDSSSLGSFPYQGIIY